MNASHELRKAIITALNAHAPLMAIVTKVYDDVPPNAVFPYVSWGPEQWINDDADCQEALEGSLQIDVWSKEIGYRQCSEITDAVRKALNHAPITLADNALVDLEVEQIRHMKDADERVRHGVVTIKAMVEVG